MGKEERVGVKGNLVQSFPMALQLVAVVVQRMQSLGNALFWFVKHLSRELEEGVCDHKLCGEPREEGLEVFLEWLPVPVFCDGNFWKSCPDFLDKTQEEG